MIQLRFHLHWHINCDNNLITWFNTTKLKKKEILIYMQNMINVSYLKQTSETNVEIRKLKVERT